MKKLSVNQTLIVTIGISALLIAVGVISSDTGIIGNAVILSTFIIASPILFLRYKKFREFKEMEERFPTLLRDIIESLRAGLPLHKAIVSASNISYGSLSKEVRKMSNQISWGIPVDKVLEQFAERVKGSRRMYAGTQVIREAHTSGGDVILTLESVAESQLMLLDAERERAATLNQYVVVMYAISIIIIVIVIGINRLMIPIFNISEEGEFGIGNPCFTCSGLECTVCTVYETTSTHIFNIDSENIGAYYTSLFFFMTLIQSIASGLVAGQISEGSLVAGVRHSMILASITFGTFSILVRLGLLGV